MTKKEFVNAFAEKGELKIKDSERLVNAFLETIEDALLKGDGVRFIGFGSWEVKERSAREVKNPQTGKMIKVEAKKVVKFKVGKPLADKVAALDFSDFKILFPAFITIFTMPLTYSISTGLALGFLSYLIVHILVGDFKKLNITLFFIGAICLLHLLV